jgi:hypothetical protein
MIYSYFQNNENFTDRTNPHYDRLWKIRRVFSYLNNKYYTLYNPTEYWAVHEVTVKFKARVAFGQYILKKRKIQLHTDVMSGSEPFQCTSGSSAKPSSLMTPFSCQQTLTAVIRLCALKSGQGILSPASLSRSTCSLR